MNTYEKINSNLVVEFDRYIMEHPEFAAQIPENAQIIFQLESNPEYNEWIEKLAEKQREKKQPVVYVYIRSLKPVHSRLVKPQLQEAMG